MLLFLCVLCASVVNLFQNKSYNRAQASSSPAFSPWTENWLTREAAGLRRRSLSSGGREATTSWTWSLPRRPRTDRRRDPADGSGSLAFTLGTNSSPRGRPGDGRRAFTHLGALGAVLSLVGQKITNLKHQIPNNIKTLNPNHQNSRPLCGFGIWKLGFVWVLVLEI
jgi:hypothetical protein